MSERANGKVCGILQHSEGKGEVLLGMVSSGFQLIQKPEDRVKRGTLSPKLPREKIMSVQ